MNLFPCRCVIGGIAFIVLVCSLIEALCLKRPAEPKPEEDSYAISGIPYLNNAYDTAGDQNETKLDSELPSEVKQGQKLDTNHIEMKQRKPDVLANSKTDVSENFSVDSDRTEDVLAIEKDQREGRVLNFNRYFVCTCIMENSARTKFDY